MSTTTTTTTAATATTATTTTAASRKLLALEYDRERQGPRAVQYWEAFMAACESEEEAVALWAAYTYRAVY